MTRMQIDTQTNKHTDKQHRKHNHLQQSWRRY